jgi:nucleoside-diphosphate-sugar epimerase
MNTKTHNIAMSGATGFVGSNLNGAFRKLKWQVAPLGRKEFKSGQLADKMIGADVVVNLAGAPVINRWTEEYKKTMYESRVNFLRSDIMPLEAPIQRTIMSKQTIFSDILQKIGKKKRLRPKSWVCVQLYSASALSSERTAGRYRK